MPEKIWTILAWGWTVAMAALCLVSFRKLPEVGLDNADKYVHFTLHFIFVALWYFSYRKSDKSPRFRLLVKALLFSVLYGCLIEVGQEYLTATRHADLKDVAANFAGGVFAVVLLAIANRMKKNRTI